MRWIVVGLLAFFMFTGCQKDDVTSPFDAHYSGTFTRISGDPVETPMFSDVTIRFKESTFEGTSTTPRHPAVCAGTYRINQTQIDVVNECSFTADFDWTLIFDGAYQYEQHSDSLRLWRVYTNGSQDIYELKKVK